MRLNPSLHQTKGEGRISPTIQRDERVPQVKNSTYLSYYIHCAIVDTSNHYSATERKASCHRGGANGSLPEEAMWESVRGSQSLLQSV